MAGHNARIRSENRNTNDAVPMLGAGLAKPLDLRAKINETAKYKMKDLTKRSYRNKIREFTEFLRTDPASAAYCIVGVTKVPDDMYNDPTYYYYPGTKVPGQTEERFEYDLVYEGMDPDWLLHYLTVKKVKSDGKICGSRNLEKFKDAILWGAEIQKKHLPRKFYDAVENHLRAFKKEVRSLKQSGNNLVEDKASDPINFSLYTRLLDWCLEENNIMAWHWTQAQWSLMARSASIDPLHVKNFRLGPDSIIIKYDDSKTEAAATRLAEKNVFANPFDFRLCYWTGLGIWVSI